jgi:hypothetical protein
MMFFWVQSPCGFAVLQTASFSETSASTNHPHGDVTQTNIVRIVTYVKILNLKRHKLFINWGYGFSPRRGIKMAVFRVVALMMRATTTSETSVNYHRLHGATTRMTAIFLFTS